MATPPVEVHNEDNHVVALAQYARAHTPPKQGDEETTDRAVKAYLKEKFGKPGNGFLGIVHRLDRPTSGVLLFARTSKAAARLSEQFRAGSIEQVNWDVVEGEVGR